MIGCSPAGRWTRGLHSGSASAARLRLPPWRSCSSASRFVNQSPMDLTSSLVAAGQVAEFKFAAGQPVQNGCSPRTRHSLYFLLVCLARLVWGCAASKIDLFLPARKVHTRRKPGDALSQLQYGSKGWEVLSQLVKDQDKQPAQRDSGLNHAGHVPTWQVGTCLSGPKKEPIHTSAGSAPQPSSHLSLTCISCASRAQAWPGKQPPKCHAAGGSVAYCLLGLDPTSRRLLPGSVCHEAELIGRLEARHVLSEVARKVPLAVVQGLLRNAEAQNVALTSVPQVVHAT